MRIISKFHDYYDSVQRTGMDKEIVYVRETKESLIKSQFDIYCRGSSNYTVNMLYLGFCGQIYKIYTISKVDEPIRIYYDYEQFKEESLALGATGKYDFGRRWWMSGYDKFRDSDTKPLLEFFHKYQVPVFIVMHSSERGKHKLVLNPNLKQYKFQTIKDTYTAYQDIFQFVAGVLNAPENKMVQISNQDKIDKHGFDKHSFRKLPTKKK